MNYSIRLCESREELEACIRIQREIWGYSDRELYPLRLFVNLNRIGGHVIGAFTADDQLAGFVAAMPAWHGSQRYLHSLSLGVVPGQENRGLGRALKLAQREEALRIGVDCIEWTFDPLRAKNAYLNIVRLGAIMRRYLEDYYGEVDSRMQQGLPSDRVIAEWWLQSRRVKQALGGKPLRDPKSKPLDEVEIPVDMDSLVAASPQEARQRQAAVREQLQKDFAARLAITDFTYDGNSARYLLEKYEDQPR